MSPKLRRLSGQRIIAILDHFDFQVISQRGSHAKLRRIAPSGAKETMTIPVHEELDVGTVHAIFKQASRYVPQELLRPYFYSD
ncbi:MAG: type II toxin-antitoxin system HicA family toxin [Chloroflexi bacterium]|nr:type II toxin-antitoxin system HicA family toxin [Chloroflexota bacterium]